MVDRCILAAWRLPGRLPSAELLKAAAYSRSICTPKLNCVLQLQYKFKVDGEWRYDPLAPLARDQEGNLNNVLELLDPQLGYELPADFDAPPSPVAR